MASDDFGAIERSVDESIVTCFYCIGLPLWPRHSVYVTTRDGPEHRIPIPLQRKSVVLGYLRKPLWFAAVVLGAPATAARRAGRGSSVGARARGDRGGADVRRRPAHA